MTKSITSCLTNYITMDPITTLIIASLIGVCVVHIHKSYKNDNNNIQLVTYEKKILHTFEEDIYLEDDEDGPIWF